MNVYVDVDKVVAEPEVEDSDGPYDYTQVSPIRKNIEHVNALYKAGHHITYYTARGTETGEDWRQVTLEQLRSWGCEFHELRMGKPAFDMLIDDKAYNEDRIAEVTESLT